MDTGTGKTCGRCGTFVKDGTFHLCTTSDANVGWICPRCGLVNAPSVARCSCTRESAYLYGATAGEGVKP